MITKKRVLAVALVFVAFYFLAALACRLLGGGMMVYLLLAVSIIVCTVLCFTLYDTVCGAFAIIRNKVRDRLYGITPVDKIYPVISGEQKNTVKNALKITFTGDLILLREMVERAYDTQSGEYNFDSMFAHVSDIWKSSDLALGVFEGPLGGESRGYSTSNYADGIPLALNFPDSFATAVKNSGIDLVTVANNHIFDVGIEGGMRTLDKLDEIGLDYVGAYRNKKEYDTPKIVSLNGKRIGVLAYTYGQNGVCDDFFFDEKTRFYMRPVVSADSKYFKRNVSLVKDDFERLKAEHPDLVIVLPHMGAQFRRQPDTTQRKWCDIFVELGADIIFSDHTHHVQPLEWRKNSFGKNVLIVHCPGNFVNSYVGYNGDASMIVSAYLDRDTLEPVAASVTPVYAHCPQNGMWIGLPVYKAVTDKGIYSTLSRADYRRLAEVHRLVTEVAIDAPLGIDNVQKEYYYFPETGYVRNTPPILENCNDILCESCIVQCISEASSVCFVGDSVTEGTKNGGYGWFEPLAGLFPDKRISRFAKGGETSRWLLQNAETVADVKAALYVVAIGCNDIRYRNDSVCAMSAQEYVDNIEKFVRVVLSHNPAAKFAFIAPWRSLYFDAYFNVTNHSDRMRLYSDYTQGLESYCHSAGHLFLDPNPWIFDRMTEPVIRTAGQGSVLRDFIHPDAFNGIALYSRAVAACRKIDDN